MKTFSEILSEGFEDTIIKILKAKKIESHFEDDILFIKKLDDLPKAKDILKKSSKVSELPTIKHGQKR
jgi:hypothetical protein